MAALGDGHGEAPLPPQSRHAGMEQLQGELDTRRLHSEGSVGQLQARRLPVEGLSRGPLLRPCQTPEHQELRQAEEKCCARQLQAVAHQSMVRELAQAGVAEQQSGAPEGAAHLEGRVRRLRPEAVAQRQLEPERQQSREGCKEREQAVRRRDEPLRQAWAEGARAHGALPERERQLERQRAQARQLEARLQQVQRELERSRAECRTLRREGQVLRHESGPWVRQAAQATAQLEEEQVLLPQSRLRAVEEQLAQLMCHMQAGCPLGAEHGLLRDRLSGAEAERAQKREMLRWQAEAPSRAERQLQGALQAAQQHQRTATRLELDLASRREGLSCLQQQLCTARRRLGGPAQCWQREQEAARLALAEKDEALVVAKVELASLQERCCRLMEEKEELQKEASLLRQEAVLSRQEVASLQAALEAAHSDIRQLQRERALGAAIASRQGKQQK